MRRPYSIALILGCAFFLFSSFRSNIVCDYVSSNMGYVKDQTAMAIDKEDIHQTHFYTYRAIKAIERSKKGLLSCGCDSASNIIETALQDLILASKSTTLSNARVLLHEAMKKMGNSIEILNHHDSHLEERPNKANTSDTMFPDDNNSVPNQDMQSKYERIDLSLVNYKRSLDHAINTVDCERALAFAQRIYNQCEQQLLVENLSEEKKYYNLKTKEITQNALNQLGDCSQE